ncbi:hypothetical protein UVI_02059540 [Ustilaginoidea virens]|uniref:Uncharacterized protein n=1 Tax=Ustilaginoidea virens TaxID=1159556 RepID=A0A1B5L6J9_USTVR|nr:hypothetical protein UVI_02059540 [Ustilaginoidea virens]
MYIIDPRQKSPDHKLFNGVDTSGTGKPLFASEEDPGMRSGKQFIATDSPNLAPAVRNVGRLLLATG